jgi:cation diffusion facilitator CzcD-associated flavoprotein CzcO
MGRHLTVVCGAPPVVKFRLKCAEASESSKAIRDEYFWGNLGGTMKKKVSAAGSGSIQPNSNGALDIEALVIGSGFSGIGAGVKLKEAGIPFLVLEKAPDLGGTWRDNTYPGIAVDITSFTYSFSYEQLPDWSRVFAPGSELKKYADHCAEKYGVRPHMRFNAEVTESTFDPDTHSWVTKLKDGSQLRSRYLVLGTGGLTIPKLPQIDGIDTFKGKKIHTARWDHNFDLTGKRVGIIGTGATSVQLVPTIAPIVKELHVYQRTPIWILPKPDAEISSVVKLALRYIPGLQWLLRGVTNSITELVMVLGVINYKKYPQITQFFEKICLNHLKEQVEDPTVREKLTPHYGFGCKRPSFHNEYLKSFNRSNVELVTDGIERVTENAIVTKDGKSREIDVLITATGFKTFEKGNTPPFPVNGLGGKELGTFFDEERYQAYEGISIPKFPNLFMMLGPYAATGASWFQMVENQSHHLVRVIKEARARGMTKVEPRQEAHDRYHADIMSRQADTVFFNNNCGTANSYYFDRHGDAPFMRPMTYAEVWWHSHFFNLDDYSYEQLSAETGDRKLAGAMAAK